MSGSNGWVLLVDESTYTVKGVGYSPVKVGEDPGLATLRDWMLVTDTNTVNIFAYLSFVDANFNNQQDPDEPNVGDFSLLQAMGANTFRLYHHASNDPRVIPGYGGSPSSLLQFNHPPNKALLRDLYQTYGIRVAMGDFLGAYTIGSGAQWEPGTDYLDPIQKAQMLLSVTVMVEDFKDEDFLLFYVLGNENNYPWTHTNAGQFPVQYAQFVEQAVQLIHTLDPNHPVCICQGDIQFISELAQNAPSVDIFGTNAYRGLGFGDLWQQVASVYNKPVVLTEYGDLTPQVNGGILDEQRETTYHQTNWLEISSNTAGGSGVGNALGGFAYEWMDEWWKDGQPFTHNTGPNNNEWHGLVSQGDGVLSPYIRQLRQVYGMYQSLWNPGGRPGPGRGGSRPRVSPQYIGSPKLPTLAGAVSPNPGQGQTGHVLQGSPGAPKPSTPSDTVSTLRIYPNPFFPSRGETVVNFINLPANTRIRIYTFSGELIKEMTADGTGLAQWDGTNDSGQTVASGVYLIVAEGNGGRKVTKVAIQR